MNWVWSWSDYIYQGLCVCGQSNVYAFGEADPNVVQMGLAHGGDLVGSKLFAVRKFTSIHK
ncbi:hypothetical protein M513_01088 [Trichuris suis]|uniref:Uncharacterized protein n=1 Tax=Trichuris suis TaxID=68888 RepID=A0A085MKV9_9BILA|nr:hypothetical protein M513_01088 [Trichuris suis]